MGRMLAALAVLVFCVGGLMADDTKGQTKDNKKANKPAKATITKVDAKKGTVTVKMKDKNGKDEERTFKLTEDIRYVDSTGKVAAIDIFRSGDEVLVVEEQGKLKELHKDKNAKGNKEGKTGANTGAKPKTDK